MTNRFIGFMVLCMVTVSVWCFLCGYWSGQEHTNNILPNCQEDEFLYPVDYTGPGNNVASDYRCFNFEVTPSGDNVIVVP